MAASGELGGSSGMHVDDPFNATVLVVDSSQETEQPKTSGFNSSSAQPPDAVSDTTEQHDLFSRDIWTIGQSDPLKIVHIQQDGQGFFGAIEIVAPGNEYIPGSKQFFEDDDGVKWEIVSMRCMACHRRQMWEYFNLRSQEFTKRACMQALRDIRGDQGILTVAPKIGKVLCKLCSHRLPGESSQDYLMRMSAAGVIRTWVKVEVKAEVCGSERLDRTGFDSFSLASFNGPLQDLITEQLGFVARRAEDEWQTEPMPEGYEVIDDESDESDSEMPPTDNSALDEYLARHQVNTFSYVEA